MVSSMLTVNSDRIPILCISRDQSLHSFFVDDHCLDIDVPIGGVAIISRTNDDSSSNKLIKPCRCASCNQGGNFSPPRDCRICALFQVYDSFDCEQQMLVHIRRRYVKGIVNGSMLKRISLKAQYTAY